MGRGGREIAGQGGVELATDRDKTITQSQQPT